MVRRISLALVLALASCATIPKLAPNPPNGERQDVIFEANGVEMRAVVNAWRESPESAAEHFTPIFVQLVNRSEQAYDITFANMSLVDEQGRIYAAVPPIEVVRSTVGSAEPLKTEVLLASAGDLDAPLLSQLGFGFGVGPSYDPFDPMSSSYSPYGNYPSSADAARNVVTRGLREGRLLPKTQAMGFVYFQRAYDGKELQLRVSAQPEQPGVPMLELQAAFTVAH